MDKEEILRKFLKNEKKNFNIDLNQVEEATNEEKKKEIS
jgi:hypothetical protein